MFTLLDCRDRVSFVLAEPKLAQTLTARLRAGRFGAAAFA
jgi:hypothetical protein